MEVVADNPAIRALRRDAKGLRESVEQRLCHVADFRERADEMEIEAREMTDIADQLDAAALRLSN